MKFIWEFFEHLNEMVYASDINTNTLVYMNAHLRTSLGFHSHEEYIGKKCYEVLQGINHVCAFCNNCKLQPGQFLSWTHTNPILKQSFLVKDTMVIYDNVPYRLEFAINLNMETTTATPYYYAHNDAVLNECLQQLFSKTNPGESIECVLAYIGKTFLCDRCYIFEFSNDARMYNTYEWRAKNITSQKEILHGESIDCISWWIEHFHKNQIVVLKDIETIRIKHPATYAILKSQNITSLVAGSISAENKVFGCIGVDNPNLDMLPMITPLINIIGYFLLSLLRRRDLINRLSSLSFHDSLTGAYNRNAMTEHYSNQLDQDSIGVIYCDITGLKRTNDIFGHEAGDTMICYCYNLIHSTLNTNSIYRTGGDEFVTIFPNCKKDDFLKITKQLRREIEQGAHHIAVGYAWSDTQPLNLEMLISEADKIMYQDKRAYYAENLISKRECTSNLCVPMTSECKDSSLFAQFLSSTYHDSQSLFRSISQNNSSSYFYFGDMQKDLFYISDNMRNEFDFDSNIVPNLLRVWKNRISTKAFQELYIHDLEDMFHSKHTVHDLRYQVRTIHGTNMWVHSYGILRWNEDKTRPLFFSGRITHREHECIVDPVTNFPRVSAIFSHLNTIRERQESAFIIGFSLNHITEINNTKGRSYTDRLLKKIARQLIENFSDSICFYRLEGMRCIALVNLSCHHDKYSLIEQIRDIIQNCYRSIEIPVHDVCSFCLMDFPYPFYTPENFQDHINSLIRMAKHNPDSPYVDYSIENIHQIEKISRLELAINQDIMHGMQHFRIMIQPVIAAENGKVICGEVLLRWSFEGQDISPAVFIPILEKNNMIHLVGRWVFEQAVRSCVRLITYIPDFYLTFNVSSRQFLDLKLTNIMKLTLEKYHLSGVHLIAEVTESCLDEQPENLSYFLDECRQMDICIAIDDFGSSSASLRMLLHYPCNIIKLDRSLLEEMEDSDSQLEFIRSIVYACHRFGKKVCMEGVENSKQNALIHEAGCDMIQGFYHHRPMEISQLYTLLSEMESELL